MSAGPRLIVIEGLDATGKTTLARRLGEELRAVVLATPASELADIRARIEGACNGSGLAAQLFYASAVAAASERARLELAAGRSVVVDRYWLSTRVHDALRTGAVDLAAVERALAPAAVTVLLETEERERLARLKTRGATAADRRATEHASFLRAAYRRLIAAPVAGAALVLDNTLFTPDETTALVLRRIVEMA
jgi:thymidylate kinase